MPAVSSFLYVFTHSLTIPAFSFPSFVVVSREIL